MHAHPVPAEPYSPVPPTVTASGTEMIRHPSPFIPIRLPVFALVIWLNDWIVRVLSVGQRNKKVNAPRTRAFSSERVESAEEGEGIELEQIREPWKGSRPDGRRAGLSGRRKLD
jgi:etoposide-induced 2.4 mRNA